MRKTAACSCCLQPNKVHISNHNPSPITIMVTSRICFISSHWKFLHIWPTAYLRPWISVKLLFFLTKRHNSFYKMHFWSIYVIDLKSKKRSNKESIIGWNEGSLGLKLNGDANLIPLDHQNSWTGTEQELDSTELLLHYPHWIRTAGITEYGINFNQSWTEDYQWKGPKFTKPRKSSQGVIAAKLLQSADQFPTSQSVI